MRRSWKRRLDRAALSRSSTVRLSAVSWRTRCLRAVFSAVIRWMVSLGPFGFQVTNLTEEFIDAGPLSEDLGLGSLEALLGIQRAFAPGRLAFVVLLGERPDAAFAGPGPGPGHGGGDGGSGLQMVIEEGAGDVRAAGDGGNADLGLLAPQSGDGRVDAVEGGFGPLAAGRQGRGRGRCGNSGGVHAMSSSRSVSSIVHVSLYSSCSSLPASARSVARKAVDHTRWK